MNRQMEMVTALVEGLTIPDGNETPAVTLLIKVDGIDEPIAVEQDGFVTIPESWGELAAAITLDVQAVQADWDD